MPFKRHNPGCPCCDEISSSSPSSSPSSSLPSSSLSSSSSISTSSVFNPCDCDEESTIYIKIVCEDFAPAGQNRHPCDDGGGYLYFWKDRELVNGTYFWKLVRTCPGGVAKFDLPASSRQGPTLTVETLNASGDVINTRTTSQAPIAFLKINNDAADVGVREQITDPPIIQIDAFRVIDRPLNCDVLSDAPVFATPSGFTDEPCNNNLLADFSGKVTISFVGGPT